MSKASQFKFKVVSYKKANGEDEIIKWIITLKNKAKTSKDERIRLKKFREYVKMLRREGTRAGEPFVKFLRGDIWELRPTDDRIIFAYYKESTFILLHHFEKTTKKTPAREMEQAERNLKELLEREGK